MVAPVTATACTDTHEISRRRRARSPRLPAAKLGAIQLCVQAAERRTIRRGDHARRRDIVDDQDLIGFPDRREAVGNHQRGPAGQCELQRTLHGSFGFGVEVAVASSRTTMLGAFNQQPRNRQPLLLSA